jgi:hypothetical protein
MRDFDMLHVTTADNPDNLTTRKKRFINGPPIYRPFYILVVRVVRVVSNAHEIDVCWLTTNDDHDDPKSKNRKITVDFGEK